MGLDGLVFIAAGIAAVAVGAWRIRAPLATVRQLDATAANLERYDVWRGRDTAVEAEGPTGADEMRAFMRRRAQLWGALIAAGAIAVVAGFLIR